MHELNLFRRHVPECKHAAEGARWLKCDCPIHIYGRLPSGETIRRGLATRDWNIAMRKLDLLARGELTVEKPVERHTVADGIAAFLTDCRRRALQPGTLHNYEVTLGFMADAIGSKPAADITAEDIALWNASRRTPAKRTAPDGVPLMPRTAAKELTFARMLFTFLRNREWITRNPAALVRPPKLPAEGATLPFSEVETRKILAGLESYKQIQRRQLDVLRLRALVPLLLYSGLRIGDAATLTRSQIEWKSRYLIRRQQKTGTHVRISLPENVILALDTLPESLFADMGDSAKATTRKLSGMLERLGDHIGVHVTAHRFRDSFAVSLLTAGADIRTVQLLLGHSSVRVTEKAYARFVPEHQRLLDAATARLNYDDAAPIAMPSAG